MAKISEQNARSQAFVLPASVFCSKIEAILAAFGFDCFHPVPLWRTLRYRQIPSARRLAPKDSISNLESKIRLTEP
jgi:hypothetical protein